MESAEESQADDGPRERPEYLPATRREGSGIGLTLIVGACLATAIAGGAAIYIETVADWHKAQNEQAARTKAQRDVGKAAVEKQSSMRDKYILDIESRVQAAYIAEQNALKRGELRCVNGSLFRRLPNGWENLPNRTCN